MVKLPTNIETMASSLDKNIELSNCAKGLAVDIQERYKIKIAQCEGTDPYTVKKAICRNKIDNYPAVLFLDICNYLVLQTSFYTTKQMKAYKSMEAYNNFISGWVKEIGTKRLQNNSALLIGR